MEMTSGKTTQYDRDEERARLLARVEKILSMPPDVRREKLVQLLRPMPEPAVAALLAFASTLGYAALGTLKEYPALGAVLSDMLVSDEGAADLILNIGDVLTLAVMTCAHGIALEVNADDARVEVGAGRATETAPGVFRTTECGDGRGVPYGKTWDGGPDGKGH